MTKSLSYPKEIISSEGQALINLAETLDDNFTKAVEKILDMSKSGHIIVAGMGKAGFMGMKISGTFSSIGVPSFFLHPAEAIHGDLGRYTKDDLALILSNSGETDEIIKIIPTIKRIGCPIISISGSPQSTLAKHSDIHISIGKVAEVGPMGLAPTTSAVLMLAIGDALAMTILKEKKLTPDQFAFYHPGGNLGRSLMQAHEIMRREESVCFVEENLTIKEVVKAYSKTPGRPGAAIVIDANKKLIGIFTDGDLRRCLDKDLDFINTPVKEIMGKNPKFVYPDMLISEVLRVLTENKIDQVIVKDHNDIPLGLVDIQDLYFLNK